MIKRTLLLASLLLTIAATPVAAEQTPSPEALATARELVAAAHAAENVKTLLPAIVQHMKPLIVQGRPQVERDFDTLVPLLLGTFSARVRELTDRIAVIYASNFTVEEMRDLIAFYRTPTGQKLLTKLPVIARQSMAAGQQFGMQLGREMQQRIIEELRKKGHNI